MNAVFGIWCRFAFVWNEVSEEHIATTFREEKSVSEEPE
jgi:hypothetical protein